MLPPRIFWQGQHYVGVTLSYVNPAILSFSGSLAALESDDEKVWQSYEQRFTNEHKA